MGEVIRVSGRAPNVGEFLKEAMLSQRFADVALCCPGGQRFLAHRLVLSAASPYLQEVGQRSLRSYDVLGTSHLLSGTVMS
ncbi:hypothetical protein WN51_04204 [Melipona quadrifasciata]|uniref:BTB domain-containing protein n=1 Tax=Melipona quadrifasciata TaxID=166423 RepID=A0A0N0BE01_9HYME|nr:hypothetical protein WN51_04204 [Melipona quadrifasciata]